jgi:O-antigen/teichoic acid export membrane protein
LTNRISSGIGHPPVPRIGIHSRRSATVVADQAISSGSNFLLAIAVGRFLGPHDFGAFALAVAIWIVAYGVFRALVQDPMTVFGEKDIAIASYLGATVLVSTAACVVLVVGALLAGIDTVGGSTVVVLAVFSPALFVQDFWRRVAFMRGVPMRAVWNDLAFVTVQITGLVILERTGDFTAGTAVAAWGLGAAAGAMIGIRQFRPGFVSLRDSLGVLRTVSRLGSWLVLDFLLNRSAKQAVLFVIAATLGSAAVGGVQVSITLLGFTNILILGGSAAALSDGSRAFENGGIPGMRRVVGGNTVGLTATVAACTIAFALAAAQVIPAVYGHRFDPYVSIAPIVSLGLLVQVLDTYPVIVMRIVQDTYRLFICRLISTPIGLTLGYGLTAMFGLNGAAYATVAVAASLVAGGWLALLTSPRYKAAGDAGGSAGRLAMTGQR